MAANFFFGNTCTCLWIAFLVPILMMVGSKYGDSSEVPSASRAPLQEQRQPARHLYLRLQLTYHVALLAIVPIIIGNLIYGRFGWSIEQDRIDRVRLTAYMGDLLINSQSLPELRLLGSDHRLLKHYQSQMNRFLFKI